MLIIRKIINLKLNDNVDFDSLLKITEIAANIIKYYGFKYNKIPNKIGDINFTFNVAAIVKSKNKWSNIFVFFYIRLIN